MFFLLKTIAKNSYKEQHLVFTIISAHSMIVFCTDLKSIHIFLYNIFAYKVA